MSAVTGCLGVAAGLSAFAFSAPFTVLALASVALGAMADLVVLPVEAALAEQAGEDLDRQLGRQHVLSFLGDLLGPLLLAVGGATTLGWQGAFGVTALSMVAFAGYLALTPLGTTPNVVTNSRAALAEVLVIAKRRDVLLLAVMDMLLNPLDEAFLALAVARAARSTGSTGITGIEQLLAVGAVIGGMAGSALVARRGLSRRMRRAGPILLMAGTVAVTAGGSLAVQALSMGAGAAGMALVWATLHHRELTVVAGRSATVSSVIGTIGAASAVIPATVGVVAGRYGLTAALSLYIGVAGTVVVLAAKLSARDTEPADGATV